MCPYFCYYYHIMPFINLFYIFFIYSFFGQLLESIFLKIVKIKPPKNHFPRGPFRPIYGFGAILIAFFALPFYPNLLLFFLTSIFVTSVLEYFSSFFFDKIFHITWWDYSDQKLHLEGRISLKQSLLWGLASIFLFLPLFPYTIILSHLLSIKLGILGFAFFLAYFIYESMIFLKKGH